MTAKAEVPEELATQLANAIAEAEGAQDKVRRLVARAVKASSVGAVARELDLTETALREWVRQAEIDAGRGQPEALTTDERAELAQLRREVRTLRMERDILKKATAFFAKESE